MHKEIKVIFTFIGSLASSRLFYVLLHEGGHVLIAALNGAKIVAFNITNGYIVAEGGTFNTVSLSLFYLAGMCIPAMVFMIYLLLYGEGKTFYKIFSAMFAGNILFSIGVWVVVPMLYMLGTANPNDDVVRFIEVSKIKPVSIIVDAISMFSVYVWAINKKKIFKNAYNVLKS